MAAIELDDKVRKFLEEFLMLLGLNGPKKNNKILEKRSVYV